MTHAAWVSTPSALRAHLVHHKEDSIRIPMVGDIRSLNLGNSVAIVLYEALRQNQFAGMNLEGHLHRLEWDV